MKVLISAVLLVPALGCLLVYSIGNQRETAVSWVVRIFKTLSILSVTALLGGWCYEGAAPFEWNLGMLYESSSYHFPIYIYLDKVGVVFLGVTSYLSTIVVRFSRYYMHRERGYTRFFATIFLFVFGMYVVILAGTIDLLFAGWEIVGISSFLLIAFYRERAAPVRNALIIYAVYRVCDVGVLLGAWLAHTIWHDVQHFSQLAAAVQSVVSSGELNPSLTLMSFLILLAAAGKSGQFPFSFWVPRAMEGPTPSSAIFYGALSIHLGVFLLLRLFPLWQAVPSAVWGVGLIGLTTAFMSTLSGRVQSNIKGQIGYASVTQVGIMLVELALGFPNLALAHFVANAGLRCFQLLVSPSVVVQVLRMQSAAGSNLSMSEWSPERRLPEKLRSSFYALAFHEGYLLDVCRAIFVLPLFWIGGCIHRIDRTGGRLIGLGLVLIALSMALEGVATAWLAIPVAILMGLSSLSALAENQSAVRAWNAVGFSCVFAGVAVFLGDGVWSRDFLIYFLGIVPPMLLGHWLVRRLAQGLSLKSSEFFGRAIAQPVTTLLFFICVLGLVGFPIGPAFVGEDALLFHSVGSSLWLSVILTFGFVINGVSGMRLFARLCLGAPPVACRKA